MAAPLFGTKLVASRTRIVLAFLLTLLLFPNLPVMPQIDLLSVSAIVLIAQQLLIGIAMGFSMQIFLQIFVVAGQMIAMQMGLGFASMVDPTSGVSVTVLSQFHLMLMTLLLISMNGHLAMIEVLVASFHSLPIGGAFIHNNMLWDLVGRATWMFGSAMLISLPAIASMLIINFSMGVVTRAAPQLNIFAIGFPFMLVVGLCVVWVTLGGYLPLFDRFTREALDMMALLVKP